MRARHCAVLVIVLACKQTEAPPSAPAAKKDAASAPAAAAWGVATSQQERDGAAVPEACQIPRGDKLDAWLKKGPAHVHELATSGAPCAEDALLAVARIAHHTSDDSQASMVPVRLAAARELATIGGIATLAQVDDLFDYPDDVAAAGKRTREAIWKRFAARLGATPGKRVAVALTIHAWRPRRLDVAPLLDKRLRALGFEPVAADAANIDAILDVSYTEKEEHKYEQGSNTSDWLDGFWCEPRSKKLTKVHVLGESAANTFPAGYGTAEIENALQAGAGEDFQRNLAELKVP